jgi:hypothetical protein
MSRMVRLSFFTLALTAAAGALGACQAIAGIEDRTYVASGGGSNGGAGGGSPQDIPSQECIDYCDKAKDVCQTDQAGNIVPNGVLYLSDEACLATCKQMPLTGMDQNSVACRVQQLRFVDTGEDVPRYCANAGPGGNGVCGTNCENYCQVLKTACRDEFEKYAPTSEEDDGIATCVKKCSGLEDTGLFDATMNGNYLGDTLQCRLVHLSSSLLDPKTHCSHAELKPLFKCVDDPMATPDCKKFCHLDMAECAGFPVYENEAQCVAVCEKLELGHVGDTTQNTAGCRMYHAYNSMLDPKNHCAHTSPGGDGHCVDGDDHDAGNCQSYCLLLAAACEDDFNGSFADQEACQADCRNLEGADADSGYSTAAKGNNLQCRLLHVSRALTNPSKECAAAQGAAPCK